VTVHAPLVLGAIHVLRHLSVRVVVTIGLTFLTYMTVTYENKVASLCGLVLSVRAAWAPLRVPPVGPLVVMA
jgi:hypothetical protein